ncbi:ABC transporter substrate-binding protein [Mesorhizobium sp. M1338]|uniref:ABC transporter substrate-binding protein n=1 Tax=Mesorhizobium sp. M1338 TaxID=2957085 RepID=UPI00333B022B
MSLHRVNRRTLLKSGAALSGGLIAADMPLSQAIWAAEGKVLTVRSDYDIDKLDPGFYNNSYNVDVMNCIYSKLTRYKTSSEWGWELEAAETIEQVDPTHIRFRLKKGIKFTGDHGEMTAKDVKFSFERIIKHNSTVMLDWGSLDRVDLEDDYTGVIVFKSPYIPCWNVALPYGAGHIVSENAVMKATKDGGDFGMKPPAFSGPYVLTEWKANQHVVLTRNLEWSGPAPGFDEIRILPIADVTAAQRAYQAGDVDFTFINLASLQTLKSQPPIDTKVEDKKPINYVWVGMNVDHPNLKDINVRKAIQWGINVPQILDVAYAGQANVATGVVAPGIIGNRDKALVPPEGDLEKAKQFLQKAGVSELDLTITCVNQSAYSTIAETVQAQLSQIGIIVNVNVQDPGSFNTIGMESQGNQWKDIQLIVNFFTSLPDPYYATYGFMSDQVGIWNWERFRSVRFDELSNKGIAVSDPVERAKLYHEMQDLMEDSGAYRFLTNQATPIMYRTTAMQAATRPDGRPLYIDFKPA